MSKTEFKSEDLKTRVEDLEYYSYTFLSPFALTKCGRVVEIECQGNLNKDYADGEVICTIPSGFRPVIECNFQIFDVTGAYKGSMRVRTNGEMIPIFGTLKMGTIRFHIIYISE